MAQIATTATASGYIERIIDEAKEYIFLVSPYLKIATPLMSRLSLADQRDVRITIIYGKQEKLDEELQLKLESYKNLNLLFLKNLHAKCYMNEQNALLGSLNLYEFSQVNNWELCVSLDHNDTELRGRLYTEIKLMISNSTTKIQTHKNENPLRSFPERMCSTIKETIGITETNYTKEYDGISGSYLESIFCIGYPNKNYNIELSSSGYRIDFNLFFPNKVIEHLKETFDPHRFNPTYRVYKNRRDCLSVYPPSEKSRNWDSQTEQFRLEYIKNAITVMDEYIQRLPKELDEKST